MNSRSEDVKWSSAARKAQSDDTQPGPQSAPKKAISERMKAYWARRKASEAKGGNRK